MERLGPKDSSERAKAEACLQEVLDSAMERRVKLADPRVFERFLAERRGDRGRLADLLRAGAVLGEDDRTLAADLLEGKKPKRPAADLLEGKKPPNRGPTGGRRTKARFAAEEYPLALAWLQEHYPDESGPTLRAFAREVVAKRWGVTPALVKREYEHHPE